MIWLVGNKGMLGSEIELQLEKSGLEFISSDIDVDITDEKSIRAFADVKSIKWIINCAAYTAVDRAEDDIEKAYLINEKGPESLAQFAVQTGAKLIHISTDYVFSGEDSSPRQEDDEVNPVSVYGRSKLAGELKITEQMKEFFIIRTAWLYGVNGNNFVYTMLKLMGQKDAIKVVSDQIGSPTSAEDLASFVVHVIKTDAENYGVYHFSNEGEISWHDFAEEISRQGIKHEFINPGCIINKCSSSEYPTKAVRPKYSLLSKGKVKRVLSFDVPEWKESLENFFKRDDFDFERIK